MSGSHSKQQRPCPRHHEVEGRFLLSHTKRRHGVNQGIPDEPVDVCKALIRVLDAIVRCDLVEQPRPLAADLQLGGATAIPREGSIQHQVIHLAHMMIILGTTPKKRKHHTCQLVICMTLRPLVAMLTGGMCEASVMPVDGPSGLVSHTPTRTCPKLCTPQCE